MGDIVQAGSRRPGGRARSPLRAYGPVHYEDGPARPLIAGDEDLLTRLVQATATNADVAEAYERYGLPGAVSPVARDDVWTMFMNGLIDSGAGDAVVTILGALPAGAGSFTNVAFTSGVAALNYQPQFQFGWGMDAPDGSRIVFIQCAAAFDLPSNSVTGPPNHPSAAIVRDLWTRVLFI